MKKTVFITGCSTGIGNAACVAFSKRGWAVYAGSRNPTELSFDDPNITPIGIDVNDVKSIDACFEKLLKAGIVPDCVVNNAGYGLLLPFEDTPPEEIEKLFRTNVFGLMEVSRRALPGMRKKGSGTIINISSVLGTIGTRWYAAYGATKWAVEGFSEALAHEVTPLGIRIKIVEPGGTKTHFHDIAYESVKPPITEAYREKYERKRATRGSKNDYDSPESVAQLILEAAEDDSLRLRYSAKQARRTLFWQRILGRDGVWRRLAK